jgi:hypothetical protein
LTRIHYGYHGDVLGGLGKMKVQTQDVQDKIDTFYNYLANHCEKMNYGSVKRGGCHIGSGAIESANKFIAIQGLNDQELGGISKTLITYSRSGARNITVLTIKLSKNTKGTTRKELKTKNIKEIFESFNRVGSGKSKGKDC